jgi:hypothetical protein
MNDLTSILLDNHSHFDIEETVKTGSAMTFDSGKEQRVVGGSIPSFDITLTYSNITLVKYESLRSVYESNFANTFKCLFDNSIDKRSQLMTNDAEVFIFKDFQFTADAKKPQILSGRITLLSSVFFNFSAYQDLFSQSSSYTATTTTDESFIDVLEDAQPNQVSYKYSNQSIMSNIGISGRHIKDKGLKRAWTMTWLLEETDFIKLLTFYRKKSGIMGEFGIPDRGYVPHEYYTLQLYLSGLYLENVDDYINSDFLINEASDFPNPATHLLVDDGIYTKINAKFMQDSFKYQRRLDGLYQSTADFIEVR